MIQLGRYDGKMHVDCNKKRCRITGADGFEITILDDLTAILKEGTAEIHTQHVEASTEHKAETRVSIYLR